MYVAPAKREFGYYVLPILHGTQLIGRVDATVDMRAGGPPRRRPLGRAGSTVGGGSGRRRGAARARVLARRGAYRGRPPRASHVGEGAPCLSRAGCAGPRLAISPGDPVDEAEARRIAVRSQLLDGTATDVLATVHRLGFLQLDPIATVAPAQHVVLWSRLGSFDVAELDRLCWEKRSLFEWDAFLWPIEQLPLVRGFMRRWRSSTHYKAERWVRDFLAENRAFRRYVLRELEQKGPLLSRELEDRSVGEKEERRWYGSRNVGLMLTSLHLRGEVAVAGRVAGQRLWDLAERVLPETEALTTRDAERLASRSIASARSAFGSALDGWEAHPEAVDGDVPDRVTFLSPFDRLIHDRDRAEALFGFHYRLEMFVPKAKRVYGYYVLPILRGTAIIGRIEPVFDRSRGVLRIEGVWAEPGAPADAGPASATPSTGSPAGSGRSRSTSGGPLPRAWAKARGHSSGHAEEEQVLLSRHRPGLPWPPWTSRRARSTSARSPTRRPASVVTPIYQTSTFAQEAVGVNKGYDYARGANPTRTALEECLASLENAAHGHAFSSGLGATTSIMHLLDPGDHVVCVNDVYGGTYRMFSQVYEPKGYRFTYATPQELSSDADSLVGDARLVWIETPTNPLLNLVDIAAVARRDEGGRRPPRRRQHLRDAVPAAAARPRRRHRAPLDDEVPRRPLRRHRRVRRDERPDDRRAPALPPEVARRRARARSTRGSSCAA